MCAKPAMHCCRLRLRDGLCRMHYLPSEVLRVPRGTEAPKCQPVRYGKVVRAHVRMLECVRERAERVSQQGQMHGYLFGVWAAGSVCARRSTEGEVVEGKGGAGLGGQVGSTTSIR